MHKLEICDGLTLPLNIITMRTATYGTSGSGKTTFNRLLAEKVHAAKHRFCTIDLKNDWWGLKSSADGTKEGIPVVIFGGPRGDVKLIDDSGAALAETITSIEQSCVVDLDSLSRRRQEKFLTSFLEELYERNRRPMILFCDEADRYAPQKPMTQEAIMSLGASEDICRRGRKRGIGSAWITQRTAVLNKNVSDLCDLTIIFRTPGARDLDELEDRVGRIADKKTVKEVMLAAPGLNDGEAFFLSSHPKLRAYLPDPVRPIQLPLPWTFDSSATPGVGQRRREPKVLAKADLAAIESKMTEQIERAKADDPRELRSQIANLKRELSAAKSITPPVAPPKIVEKKIIADKQINRLEKIAAKLGEAMKPIADAIGIARMTEIKFTPQQHTAEFRQSVQRELATSRTKPIILANDSNGDGQPPEVGKGALRRILVALAQRNGLTDGQIGLRANVSTKGGSFGTYLSTARRAGWLQDGKDGKRFVTPEGIAAIGAFEPEPTGAELILHWQRKLGDGAAARIFDVLIRNYPNEMSNEEIGTAANVSTNGGSFGTYMSTLRRLELITSRRGGGSWASDEFFKVR